MAITRAELREVVLEIIKGTDLDCSTWHPDAQRELTEEITDEVWRVLASAAKPPTT
jgi:NTP pyrophosphatase (non-canonical NTP hydrolase)